MSIEALTGFAKLFLTCAQTMVNASHCVGFTLPGMIDEPAITRKSNKQGGGDATST